MTLMRRSLWLVLGILIATAGYARADRYIGEALRSRDLAAAVAQIAGCSNGQMVVYKTGPVRLECADASSGTITTSSPLTGDGSSGSPVTLPSSATPTLTRLTLSQSTGTAPLTVSSTTVVTNFNADTVDGRNPGSASGIATLDSSSRVSQDVAYSPADGMNWDGVVTAVRAALDELAQRIMDLEVVASGLGGMEQQSPSNVSITGGAINGVTGLSIDYVSKSTDGSVTANTSSYVNVGSGSLRIDLPTTPVADQVVRLARVDSRVYNVFVEPGSVKVNAQDTPLCAIVGVGSEVIMTYVNTTTGWKADPRALACLPPVTVSGLWVADRGVTTAGGSVSSWVDIIGSNDAAQATSGEQPTHSTTASLGERAGINFDGSDDNLQAGRVINTTGAFWAAGAGTLEASAALRTLVAQDDVSGNVRFFHILSSNSANNWQFTVCGSTSCGIFLGKTILHSALLLGQYHTFVGTYDGGTDTSLSVNLYVDRVKSFTNNNTGSFVAASNAAANLTIGSALNGAGEIRFWDGTISVAAVGTGTMTESYAYQMDGFLRAVSGSPHHF